MKHKLAVWLIRNAPKWLIIEVVRKYLANLTEAEKHQVMGMMLLRYFPGAHIHRNPKSKSGKVAA